MEYRAALLASHGFATMALDYMTPKITIETGKMVGIDYLEVQRPNISLKDPTEFKFITTRPIR